MPRPLSKVAPQWWDYTTLEPEILDDAARLTAQKMEKLSRPGFRVVMYDTLEEFYLAEALEYMTAWRQSTDGQSGGHLRPDRPHGAVAAGGPAGQRTGSRHPQRRISGAWMNGSMRRACRCRTRIR